MKNITNKTGPWGEITCIDFCFQGEEQFCGYFILYCAKFYILMEVILVGARHGLAKSFCLVI